MVRAVKSVLLFDYDSVHRTLLRHGPAVADYIGSRAGTWIEAIESGELMDPAPDEGRRRFVTKRCYADPRLLGKNRGWMSANGLHIVDCSLPDGFEQSAAAIHVVLDALEPGDPAVEEVVIMVAELDLRPLLAKLKAIGRRVVIFAPDWSTEDYVAGADAVIDEARLVAVLSRQPANTAPPRGGIPRPPRMAPPPAVAAAPPPPPPPPPPPAPRAAAARAPARSAPRPALPARRTAIDREELASLVRRIHQATNVPLFSPKAFGDLFRLLVEDVAANGYKFQATADNVANAMNALGRNVTKRQVGFVIKGLALRGHVFGDDDRPETLAEAFYAQVLFLAENANLALTEGEKGLVHAWVVGIRRDERAEPGPRAAAARSEAPTSARPPASPAAPPARRREPLVTPPPRPAAAARNVVPAEPARRPVRMPEPPPSLAAGRSRAASRAAEERESRRRSEETRRIEEEARRIAAEDEALRLAEDEEALRLAAEEEARVAARRPRAVLAQRAALASTPLPELRQQPLPAVEPGGREAELEDTILSAIADAVDVLVEDEEPAGTEPGRNLPVSQQRPPEPPADGDEIGDEIQRILSTFNQNK